MAIGPDTARSWNIRTLFCNDHGILSLFCPHCNKTCRAGTAEDPILIDVEKPARDPIVRDVEKPARDPIVRDVEKPARDPILIDVEKPARDPIVVGVEESPVKVHAICQTHKLPLKGCVGCKILLKNSRVQCVHGLPKNYSCISCRTKGKKAADRDWPGKRAREDRDNRLIEEEQEKYQKTWPSQR